MQASELRIGNLILFSPSWKSQPIEPRIVKVKRIYENSCIVLDMGLDLELAYNSEATQPIPLTDDWLLRFGLLHEISTFWKLAVNHKLAKNLSQSFKFENSVLSATIGVLWVELRFVHEYQNWYFAMTNQELETTP